MTPREPHRYYDEDLPDDEESEEQDDGDYFDAELDDTDICGPLWSPQPRDSHENC